MNIMTKVNYLAVITAAFAALVEGAAWYSPVLFGNAWMELRGLNPATMAEMKIPVWEILAEFVRSLVVAYVLARLVVFTGVVGWKGAVQLAFWVWLGFQAMAIAGSVIHENYPWQLYAIHAGDALAKTLVMAVILSVWRKRSHSVEEGA